MCVVNTTLKYLQVEDRMDATVSLLFRCFLGRYEMNIITAGVLIDTQNKHYALKLYTYTYKTTYEGYMSKY
jgi:hypothetical protein